MTIYGVKNGLLKVTLKKKLDNVMKNEFEKLIVCALDGQKDHWRVTPYGSLALIILLDQFTRNIYRNTEAAWSGDTLALTICLEGIKTEVYDKLSPIMKAEYLMPLIHAEDLQLQQMSVNMYQQLYDDANSSVKLMFDRFHKISKVHYNSVVLFGRFPERNEYLKRRSTPEEIVYIRNTQVMHNEY